MSDQTLTVRPVREIREVEDFVPILDTRRFEHMQRIASAMAQSSLIPETLRGIRKGQNFEPFETQVVVANVFRVVNQAVGWSMDPFSVLDHVSVVHGRLMYEGKLIHAVIEARLGIRLNYRFGQMKDGVFVPGEEGKGENLAVQVFGTFEDETEERTVEGWVADWKTTGNNSPWGKASNFKRQLRYRGAREWARAHAPGVILGVITDDEIDQDLERQERVTQTRRGPRQKTDIVAKLQGDKAKTGFDPDHVISETEPTDHDPVTGEVIEGEATEVRPTETASAQDAEAEPATSASASDASDDTPDPAASGPEGGQGGDDLGDDDDGVEELRRIAYEDGFKGEPVQAVLSECETDEEKKIAAEEHERGRLDRIEKEAAEHAADAGDDLAEQGRQMMAEAHKKHPNHFEAPTDQDDGFEFVDEGGPAPKGVKYLLASDEPADGRIQDNQDGNPFSKMGPKGAKQLKRYDAHPEPADPALKSQSGGTLAANKAEEPKGGLYAEVAAMESWLVIKPFLSKVYQSDDFKALDPNDQARTRANLFGAVLEMKDRTRDPVDWAADPSAFTLWADHVALKGEPDAADMIDGTFQVLQGSAAYERMKPEQKTTLEARVAGMIHKLKGAR
jgi:hypothetical protein